MKAVADRPGVARSNLVEAARGRRRSRQPYRKAGDAELPADLRRLVDERPIHGYRRLAALLDRKRRAYGEPVGGARFRPDRHAQGRRLAEPRSGTGRRHD